MKARGIIPQREQTRAQPGLDHAREIGADLQSQLVGWFAIGQLAEAGYCVLIPALCANAECRVLESDYGHCAGGPGREPAAMQQIFAAMRELLDTR